MVVQRPTGIASGLSFSFAVLCIIMFQKPHQKEKNNSQAAEQENGTNDMNSDSSANEMDEDSG